MKSYFIYTNDQQQGPYSVQELKDMGIGEEMPIWKEGFETWKKAGEVVELRSCFEVVPPPYNPAAAYVQSSFNTPKKASSASRVVKTFVKVFLWGIAIVLSIAVAQMIINNTRGNAGTVLNEPLPDPEKTNPTHYLDASGTFKQNFWGNKITIEGTITNSATHTNYKDVTIRVNFYGKTKSVIRSEDFTLFDYFPYGMTKKFELKVNKPSDMVECGWDAVQATAY